MPRPQTMNNSLPGRDGNSGEHRISSNLVDEWKKDSLSLKNFAKQNTRYSLDSIFHLGYIGTIYLAA